MLRAGIRHACPLMGISFLSILHQSSGDRKISLTSLDLSNVPRMLRPGIGHACPLMGMSFLSILHQSSGDRKISEGQVNLSSADRKVARYRGPFYKAITYITIFRHRHYRRACTIVLGECWRDPRMDNRVFWERWLIIVRSADYLLESSWIAYIHIHIA